jgi:hypothetical protein
MVLRLMPVKVAAMRGVIASALGVASGAYLHGLLMKFAPFVIPVSGRAPVLRSPAACLCDVRGRVFLRRQPFWMSGQRLDGLREGESHVAGRFTGAGSLWLEGF